MSKAVEMWEDERMPEVLEHPLAIELFAELHSGQLHQRANVPPEALRRRIVEMIGDVCDGEPGILEQARRANQSSHGEVLLWRRNACAKEPAHEGARQDIQMLGQRSHGGDLGRTQEKDFKKTPTVARNGREVDRQLTEGLPLHFVATDAKQVLAELTPSVGIADIDESAHTRRSEIEHRLRR